MLQLLCTVCLCSLVIFVKAIGGVYVAAGTVAAGIATKVAAGAAVPIVMAKTGIVVQGVGTMFASGGAAAVVQSVSMVALGPLVVGSAVTGAGLYYGYHTVVALSSP